jgi:hypothetical protein
MMRSINPRKSEAPEFQACSMVDCQRSDQRARKIIYCAGYRSTKFYFHDPAVARSVARPRYSIS